MHADLVPIYNFLKAAEESGKFKPVVPLEHPGEWVWIFPINTSNSLGFYEFVAQLCYRESTVKLPWTALLKTIKNS